MTRGTFLDSLWDWNTVIIQIYFKVIWYSTSLSSFILLEFLLMLFWLQMNCVWAFLLLTKNIFNLFYFFIQVQLFTFPWWWFLYPIFHLWEVTFLFTSLGIVFSAWVFIFYLQIRSLWTFQMILEIKRLKFTAGTSILRTKISFEFGINIFRWIKHFIWFIIVFSVNGIFINTGFLLSLI